MSSNFRDKVQVALVDQIAKHCSVEARTLMWVLFLHYLLHCTYIFMNIFTSSYQCLILPHDCFQKYVDFTSKQNLWIMNLVCAFTFLSHPPIETFTPWTIPPDFSPYKDWNLEIEWMAVINDVTPSEGNLTDIGLKIWPHVEPNLEEDIDHTFLAHLPIQSRGVCRPLAGHVSRATFRNRWSYWPEALYICTTN
jgi:hypothetical protein